MTTFSERQGLVPPRSQRPLQVDSMSDELRHSLWNIVHDTYDHEFWVPVAGFIARFHTRTPVDTLSETSRECQLWIRTIFYSGAWSDTYDLVEFLHKMHSIKGGQQVGRNSKRFPRAETFSEHVNFVLERELSAYRFVDGRLAPISNEQEVEAIEDSIAKARETGFEGAALHLQAAVAKLGLKPQPDYRNAIKEAISAVESACQALAGERATLDKALKAIAVSSEVHPALQKAFSALYGYTSDEHGVRHAMTDAPNVAFPEAKFFVVSCSAFVHYLLQKSGR